MMGRCLFMRKGSIHTAPSTVDANTLLLLHGEDLTDNGPYGVAITNNGVSVSSAQSKFGGKSLYFDGSSYLKIPLSVNGDCTIDIWLMMSAYSVDHPTPFNFLNGSLRGFYTHIRAVSSTLGCENPSGTYIQQSFDGIEAGAWHHIAVVRNGTTITEYVDGANVAAITGVTTSNDILYIGELFVIENRSKITGYIDEFRVSNIARWTADFTPPTKPY